MGCRKALFRKLSQTTGIVMQTIALFVVMMFLAGLFFGVPYYQAYKRRLSLEKNDTEFRSRNKNRTQPLDKSTP